MSVLIFSLYQHPLAASIANSFNAQLGDCLLHTFPDGETLVKINDSVSDKKVMIVDSLNQPNQKILPLVFLAKTAKELGATEVGLVSPYLAYMRQDKDFHSGEAVTSKYFAEMISQTFDWMLTVDPHLHRYHNLDEIYTIPSVIVHAATAVADWIDGNTENPVLIGPDSESEQWIKDIANRLNAPYFILEKTRLGDKKVKVTLPNVDPYKSHLPVLIDDIVSSGHTLQEAASQLNIHQMRKPICVAIHPVFSGNSYDRLCASQVDQVVSCNTIPHVSNAIDLSSTVCQGLKKVIS